MRIAGRGKPLRFESGHILLRLAGPRRFLIWQVPFCSLIWQAVFDSLVPVDS